MDSIFTLKHTKSGAQAKIHPFGATVISFQTAAGQEVLFVSSLAKTDGSKPIRGGIPLCYPCFGPDTSDTKEPMPQHGFLRRSTWTMDPSSQHDDEDSAGVTYQLKLDDVKEARGDGTWAATSSDGPKSIDCICSLNMKISATQMVTTLEIKNTGTSAFDFQALQHTYFHVGGRAAMDPAQCYVQGLEGYQVIDKISETSYPWGADPVVIKGLTDRVYDPPAGKNEVDVVIGIGKSKTVKMKAKGVVDGSQVPASCVVWNPSEEKATGMGDFGDDEYHDMICVEPGILGKPSLEPQTMASLIQEISVE